LSHAHELLKHTGQGSIIQAKHVLPANQTPAVEMASRCGKGMIEQRNANLCNRLRHKQTNRSYLITKHTEDLITIADSLGLELSPPSNPGPTRFADNLRDANSIIDLVFLPQDNTGFG